MSKMWNGKRFLASLLAALLVISTVGFDTVGIKAEEPEEQMSEYEGETSEYTEESEYEEITSEDAEVIGTEEETESEPSSDEEELTEYTDYAVETYGDGEQSQKGLLVSDWYDNGEFHRIGADEYGAWSEYLKEHDFTEGDGRPLSFASCPTDEVLIREENGNYSDNLTILNIPESERDYLLVQRENAGAWADISDEAELSYDNYGGFWHFTARSAGRYKISYTKEGVFASNDINYVIYNVNPQTNYSMKGLVFCNNGNAEWGFIDHRGNYGDYQSEYRKESGIGVKDEMSFLLALNNNDKFEFDEFGNTEVTLLESADNLSVLKLVEDKWVAPAEGSVTFGFRPEKHQDGENYCSHFYFSASSCGMYRIVYTDPTDDTNSSFVTLNIDLQRIALFTDGGKFDETTVWTDYNVLSNGINKYYLRFDPVTGDDNYVLNSYRIVLMEQGQSEKHYEIKDGKFYLRTLKDGVWKAATTPTDLSAYMSLVKKTDNLYEITFKEREFEIDFIMDGTRYEDRIGNPNGNRWNEFDERTYGIRLSQVGKLCVLDWIDGWDEAWTEDGLNPVLLRRGYDEEREEFASFRRDASWWVSNHIMYVVLGISEDEWGNSASLIPGNANIKVSYKADANAKSWTDYTKNVAPTYIGDENAEGEIAQGLWTINIKKTGIYKLDATFNEKTYSMEYTVTMPAVGLYTNETVHNDSTLVCSDVYQEFNSANNKVYYLYGNAFGTEGVLDSVEIDWPEWSGHGYTFYKYVDGKFYKNVTNPDDEGELIETDASDEVATIFDFEETEKSGIYKITPWPCDTKVRFNYRFDEFGWVEGADYFMHQSAKGILVNDCLENPEDTGVWTGCFREGDEYAYSKYMEMFVGDTQFFGLSYNADDDYPSYDKNSITRLSSLAGLSIKKVETDEDGKEILEAVDESTVLRYVHNGVFSLSSNTEGTYWITYTDRTGSSILRVYVHRHDFGFYTLDDPSASEYSFGEENMLIGKENPLTAKQANDGKAEFYVVINGDIPNTDYALIEQYWINENNEQNEEAYPYTEFVIFSQDDTWESKYNEVAPHTTYSPLDLSGKKVYVYGQEITNPIIYKVTTTRNGNPGLAYRDFNLIATDNSCEDYEDETNSPENYMRNYARYIRDFSYFGYSPADISEIELTVDDIPMNVVGEQGVIESVNITDKVSLKVGSDAIENEYLYSIVCKPQSLPGTYTYQVNGNWDFAGSKEGTYTITKYDIANMTVAIGAYVTYSIKDKCIVMAENGPEHFLSDFEKGVDYETEILTDITSDTANGADVSFKITAKEGSKYLTGNKTFTIRYDKPGSDLKVYGLGSDNTVYMTYDGTDKTESVSKNLQVTCDGIVLTEGEDYEISFSEDPINVGTYNITVQGKEWLADKSNTDAKLAITAVDISKATVTGLSAKINYNTAIDESLIKVSLNKVDIPADGWVVDGYDKTKSGAQTIKIKGVGNYTGEISKTVTVAADTTLNTKSYRIVQIDETQVFTYPSAPTADDFKVQILDPVSKEYSDLDDDKTEITFSSTAKVGKITVTAAGQASKGYAGTITKVVEYKPCVLTKELVGIEDSDLEGIKYYPGDGKQLDSKISASYTKDVDYTTKYTNDTKAGTATLTVTGKGNYTGTLTYTYAIDKYDISFANIKNIKATYTEGNYVYYAVQEGDAVDIAAADIVLWCKDTNDKEYVFPAADYTVTLSEKTFVVGAKGSPKTYTFTVTAKGNNCTGSTTLDVYAEALELNDISKGYEIRYNGNPGSLTREYNGNWVIDHDEVRLYKDGVEIPQTESSKYNYSISCLQCIEAGTCMVVITGRGNYTGVLTDNVKITPHAVTADDENITIVSSSDSGFGISTKGKVDYGTITVKYNGSVVDPKNYTYSFSAKAADGEKASLTVNYKGSLTGKVVYDADALAAMGIDSTLHGNDLEGEDANTSITGTSSYVYTGKAIALKVTVKAYGQTLKTPADYTLSYKKAGVDVDGIVGVGDYTIVVNGCGKFAGTFEDTDFVVSVTPASIAKANIALEKTSYKYNIDDYDNDFDEADVFDGYGQIKEVKIGKEVLTAGRDYIVYEYIGNKKPGTATVVIEGLGNYVGSATKTFTIDGKVDINDTTVRYVDSIVWYNPKGAVPEADIEYNGDQLVLNQDYTLTCTKNNKSITPDGDYAYVTIKGKGKYTGTYSIAYPYVVVPCYVYDETVAYSNAKEITGIDYDDEEITVYMGSTVYNGKEQSSYDPKPKVDGNALSKGKDYDVYYIPANDLVNINPANDLSVLDLSEYKTVKDAGSYFATLIYKGNYMGQSFVSYYVAPMNVSKLKITASKMQYNGVTPKSDLIAVALGKDKLAEYRDYEIYYSEKCYVNPDGKIDICGVEFAGNDLKKILKIDIPKINHDETIDCTSVGTHTAYVEGCGNYCGIKEVKYDILGEDIKKLNLTAENVSFNPSADATETRVTGSYTDANGITKYYDSEAANQDGFILEYSGNTKAGTAKVKVSHKLFKGSKTLSFKITPYEFDVENGDYLSVEHKTIFGVKNNTPDISIHTADGQIPKEGTDYTVTCKNNKAVTSGCTAIVTIKFKGNYSGMYEDFYKIDAEKIKVAKSDVKSSGTWKPTIKVTTSRNKAGLKENKDYTIKYTYYIDTWVKCGKTYVLRKKGDEVNAKDTILIGTEIKAVVQGIGNYKDLQGVCYTYAGKLTSYSIMETI